jgi:hypothetical protein
MKRMRQPGSRAKPAAAKAGETRIFRRFFDLLGRLERGATKGGDAAPETKARITRLDDTAPRNP